MSRPLHHVGNVFVLKSRPECRFKVISVRQLAPEGRWGYEMKPLFEGYPGKQAREFEGGLDTFYDKETCRFAPYEGDSVRMRLEDSGLTRTIEGVLSIRDHKVFVGDEEIVEECIKKVERI